MLGRFISADQLYAEKMDEKGINSQELNMYAYVRNNPYKFFDPSGELVEFVDLYSSIMLSESYEKIRGSEGGAKLLNSLESAETVYKIEAINKESAHGHSPFVLSEAGDKVDQGASIDVKELNPIIKVLGGNEVKADTSRVIAHELLHVVDPGANENQIMDQENAVMSPIDNQIRTEY